MVETGNQSASKIRSGLCVPGFVRPHRLLWLIDMGEVLTILTRQAYNALSEKEKFPLQEKDVPMFLADMPKTGRLG